MNNLLIIIFLVLTGAFFLLDGLFNWKMCYACKPVIGKFIISFADEEYIFEYVYKGTKYRLLSSFGKGEFSPGRNYTIYVNPTKPSFYRCSKQILYPMHILKMLTGSGLIIVGALYNVLI